MLLIHYNLIYNQLFLQFTDDSNQYFVEKTYFFLLSPAFCVISSCLQGKEKFGFPSRNLVFSSSKLYSNKSLKIHYLKHEALLISNAKYLRDTNFWRICNFKRLLYLRYINFLLKYLFLKKYSAFQRPSQKTLSLFAIKLRNFKQILKVNVSIFFSILFMTI